MRLHDRRRLAGCLEGGIDRAGAAFTRSRFRAEGNCCAFREASRRAAEQGESRARRLLPTQAEVVFEYDRWVAPDVERWVPADVWEGLTGESSISPGDTIAIGGDGSRSYDTSALAWAQKALDGRIDVACASYLGLPPEQPSDEGASFCRHCESGATSASARRRNWLEKKPRFPADTTQLGHRRQDACDGQLVTERKLIFHG